MASRKVLLCLSIVCTTSYVAECRGGGHGGSHGGGHGHSSHGSSGHSSSHGSHSSGSHGGGFFSWFSGGSKSSGSGSGGTSYSSGSNSHSYPSSGGMSGYGTYSGSSSGGSHTYPSSGSGWSGYGSHPSSSSGGSHNYPSSGTGMSGNGGGYNNGGYNTHWRTSNSHNTYYGYRPSPPHKDPYITPVTYTHYPQYVYVTEYQNSGSRYGDLLSGLTWYNLGRAHNYHYNNHYYNDDYYRRWHSSSSSDGYKLDKQPEESAVCTLRVTENGKLEVLKIPCAIVSTFIEDSQETRNQHETYVNTTVCTTNSTVTRKIASDIANKPNLMNTVTNKPIPADLPALNLVSYDPYQNNEKESYGSEADRILAELTENVKSYKNMGILNHDDINDDDDIRNYGIFSRTTTERSDFNMGYNGDINKILDQLTRETDGYISRLNNPNYPHNSYYSNLYSNQNFKAPTTTSTTSTTTTTTMRPTTEKPIIEEKLSTVGNTTIRTVKIITSTEEILNITVCKNMTDPVSVKGPSIDPSNMVCEVAVQTKSAYLRNKVDCKTLISYAKNPPPKQESVLLPEKEKLRSWVQKAPWWTSIFIAV